MSASQIPNLLNLRGGPRSRGRGRGRGGISSTSPATRRDQTIQSTDTDAAVSRLSAASSGYLDDPFAQYFVNGLGTRRLPIINRGTYTRTTAIDILIHAFLSTSQETKQIVSLGAGTDTRYFQLHRQNRHQNLVYHEFDFPPVCTAKRRIAESHKPILCTPDQTIFQHPGTNADESANAGAEQDTEWGFLQQDGKDALPSYICHPLDLRNLPSLQSLASFWGLRNDIPTLIISECCLCYLAIDTARDVIKWFGDRIPHLGILLYEPIGVDDAFGQMMVENLAARGIVMPTVQRYKTLADQASRLVELGFTEEEGKGGAMAKSIEDIWERWVSAEEKERVDALEGLDEVEEWQMLARHYAVVWGWRAANGFDGWEALSMSLE